MKPPVFHPEALAEFQEQAVYYDERSAGLGERFVVQVETAIGLAVSMPGVGSPYRHGTRRFFPKEFPHTARVEYDERDNIFVGRILGIRSIISFHGAAVAELMVDCKKEGVPPEKPASGKLLLRVPPEVHGRALVAAQAAGKSLNQWATEILQHAVQP